MRRTAVLWHPTLKSCAGSLLAQTFAYAPFQKHLSLKYDVVMFSEYEAKRRSELSNDAECQRLPYPSFGLWPTCSDRSQLHFPFAYLDFHVRDYTDV